ncbi:MAG: ATP-binding protein, partial [Polyangiaceae bacterium]
SGAQSELAWEVAAVLKVKGDPFLEAIVASDVPVVVEDARTDPRTNKEIVEKLQNRTIINIPLRLVDKPLGILGLGTFGDEGCRPPDSSQLEYLAGMGGQLSVAASRIRLVAAQARAETQRREIDRRLQQGQKLESLGMLAGGIAHDFNNLLTVMLASAVLANEMTKDADLGVELEAIIAAGTRGRELTKQLLAMSRSQQLELAALDLNARLRELIELARRVLPATLTVDFIEGKGLPLVDGDPSQLDQVFMNLLINARDAMTDGGRVTIETEQVVINGRYVATHPWAKPGRYVLVTVTDTGVGMSKEVQEHIFEPFFTTKGPRAGTGLGLAVAYGIVRQHRGMLHCYSEKGVGSSFKVYLPVLERLAISVGTKLERRIRHGNEHILLAEDDAQVRAVATRILQRGGYTVTAVEDGDAACRAAAAGTFDLLVLDVVMPGMPCREVVQKVRALHPDGKILLASGYTAGANVESLIEEHKLILLSKPYDPDQMLRAVREALDGALTAGA